MDKNTIQTLLKSSFQNSNAEDWKQAAISETKENDPLRALQWETVDKLQFSPIYSKNDLTELKYLNAFDFRPCPEDHSARSWLNLPSVFILDDSTANKIALDHLASSADGILFDVQREDCDLLKLLETIEWPHCNVSFKISTSEKFVSILKNYINRNKFADHQLTGGLFWENWPQNISDLNEVLSHQQKIYSLGIFIQSSTPIREISDALKKAVTLIDLQTDKGIPVEKILKRVAFSIPISANIFQEIAKLKALRMLWFQITQAYQIKNYLPGDLHVHTRAEIFTQEKMQPHGNMLSSTAAALAGVMGGCNSLTIYAEDRNNKMMTRIARNVSNILREESHFGKVADPTAGSYLLESMVDEIAKEAWKRFKESL